MYLRILTAMILASSVGACSQDDPHPQRLKDCVKWDDHTNGGGPLRCGTRCRCETHWGHPERWDPEDPAAPNPYLQSR